MMTKMRSAQLPFFALAAIGVVIGAPTIATAATVTDNLGVQIVIESGCEIASVTDITFATTSVLSAAVNADGEVQVTCSDTTPYDIGLGAGSGSGATVEVRKMTSGSTTIDYTLYSDASRSTVWGDTIDNNTVSGTGNGDAQAFPIYGQVPAQTTPAAGTYTDTVTVTVTY